jgi:hypothetical protein
MDHLVFAVPDLAQGIDLVERQTGVRAHFGGRHPGRGTHNALLALGGRRYLEIIAIDPEQPAAKGLLFPQLASVREPCLIAWAVAVASVADAAARARAAAIASIGPLDGARLTSPLEGLPFFIEWGAGAAHPAETSPTGCDLTSFAIEHPQGEALRRALASLGVAAVLRPGPRFALKARLKTPKGEVELC